MEVSDDTLAELSAELKDAINTTQPIPDDWQRWHLGISVIGDECQRRVWYGFRWYAREEITGRIQRIFDRGHAEETHIVNMLSRVGYNVQRHDPATGKQFLYSSVNGHYGGACDGIASVPVGIAEKLGVTHVLAEMKTHHTKSFSGVVAKGIVSEKPKHYIQMCGYGYAFKLEYALYFPVNKNDDDIHPTFYRISADVGARMEQRANALVPANKAPPRLSEKPTHFVCKSCTFHAVCHTAAPPLVHCRSCRYSAPTYNGEWHCSVYAQNIPRHIVKTGCPSYSVLDA